MALQFNGTDQSVDLGDVSQLDGVTVLSVCGWISMNDLTADHTILSKGNLGGNTQIFIWRDNDVIVGGPTRFDTLSVQVSDGTTDVTAAGPDQLLGDNDIHHFAITFEAGISDGLRMYIDGEEVIFAATNWPVPADTSAITSLDSTAISAFIGQIQGQRFFNGVIDDIRIYTKVLTSSEVLEIYTLEGGDSILEGLLSRYLMNEQGSGAASGTDSILDIGSLQNNGIQINGPAYVDALVYGYRRKRIR